MAFQRKKKVNLTEETDKADAGIGRDGHVGRRRSEAQKQEYSDCVQFDGHTGCVRGHGKVCIGTRKFSEVKVVEPLNVLRSLHSSGSIPNSEPKQSFPVGHTALGTLVSTL